jgi:hypothetical protein
MKKIALTIAMVTGASLVAYSQGQVYFNNANANGFVVTSQNSHTSSSTVGSQYTIAANFTAELWALSGPANTTAGLTGLDSFGYLNSANLVSDGFSEVTTLGNVVGSAGAFPATPGLNSAVPGTVSANTVLAVVAWTGSATSFAQALTTPGTFLGILAFVNPIGPASPTPYTGDISTGWNALANSPQSAANGGNEDLILNPVVVPEPATLTLAGLGGLASLVMLRRKKA